MRLKNINLENFKCFNNRQNIDLERITLLTGANSSGKSSILYSVLGPLQSVEFPLQFSTNGKYVNMGDFREISFNHNVGNEITLGFTFYEKNVHTTISTCWTKSIQNKLPELKNLEAKTEFYKIKISKKKNYNFSLVYDPLKEPTNMQVPIFRTIVETINKANKKYSKSHKQSETNKEKIKKLQLEYVDYGKPLNIRNKQFKDLEKLKLSLILPTNLKIFETFNSVINLFTTFDKKSNFISSFRLHPDRTYLEKSKFGVKVKKFGEGYLDQIIIWQTEKSEKYNQLVQIMKKLSLFQNISVNRFKGGRFEMLVKTKKNGASTSLSDVGFGISQFLPIIVADLQLPEDSTLLIAQPEIHLHPSVQSSFGEYLVNQLKNSKKNYIIETHSEYLLNRIRLAITKNELDEKDLSIYHIESKTRDRVLHKIRFNKKGQILNAPLDFFKTYMMDVIGIALNAVK
ncbi:hypothetical protein BH10BAC5_BH10BAC5_24930 [soil metagenome]